MDDFIGTIAAPEIADAFGLVPAVVASNTLGTELCNVARFNRPSIQRQLTASLQPVSSGAYALLLCLTKLCPSGDVVVTTAVSKLPVPSNRLSVTTVGSGVRERSTPVS